MRNTIEGYLYFQANLHKTIKIQTENGYDLDITNIPDDQIPDNLTGYKLLNLNPQLAKHRTIYVQIVNSKLHILAAETVPVIIQDVMFSHFNRKSPVFIVNGEECSGISKTSKVMFGFNHRDIKWLLNPLIPERQTFKSSDLTLISSTANSNTFKYKDKFYASRKDLTSANPHIPQSHITKLIGRTKMTKTLRHEQLVATYSMRIDPNGKYEVEDPFNGNLSWFSTQKALFEHLQTVYDEKASRKTIRLLINYLQSQLSDVE